MRMTNALQGLHDVVREDIEKVSRATVSVDKDTLEAKRGWRTVVVQECEEGIFGVVISISEKHAAGCASRLSEHADRAAPAYFSSLLQEGPKGKYLGNIIASYEYIPKEKLKQEVAPVIRSVLNI